MTSDKDMATVDISIGEGEAYLIYKALILGRMIERGEHADLGEDWLKEVVEFAFYQRSEGETA